MNIAKKKKKKHIFKAKYLQKHTHDLNYQVSE